MFFLGSITEIPKSLNEFAEDLSFFGDYRNIALCTTA